MKPWYEQSAHLEHVCLHSARGRKRAELHKPLSLLWFVPLIISVALMAGSLHSGGVGGGNVNAVRPWRDLRVRVVSGKSHQATESPKEILCAIEARWPKRSDATVVTRYVLPEYCASNPLFNRWTEITPGTVKLAGWNSEHKSVTWNIGYLFREYRLVALNSEPK